MDKDKKYAILAIDQSTAGTKALLLNKGGGVIRRADRAHKQKISENGWVAHDPMEIYRNTLDAAADVLGSGEQYSVTGIGISNQRETALVWNRRTGLPVHDAVVWQCARGESICRGLDGHAEMIHNTTGLRLSPYFSAAKIAWVLQNAELPEAIADLCAGTIDSWLIYKLTGNFKTDWSNASRTQLLNLRTLQWDRDICGLFGIDRAILPEICDSNALYGHTDFEGLLPEPVPVHGVLGDSHAALFGQGCHKPGMGKATYGTGSSVMVNIGGEPVFCKNVVTSLGWGMNGKITYVVEGNINYTGAVIKWLKDDLELLPSSKLAGEWAAKANPEDQTYLIPAFSGLGAPYWSSKARAAFIGMGRGTGRFELVKAAEECIGYQIADVVQAVLKEAGIPLTELRVDGGPTRDRYLMQFQSDILGLPLSIPESEELSAIGAAYAAGIALGFYDETVFERMPRTFYTPSMTDSERERRLAGWHSAVEKAL